METIYGFCTFYAYYIRLILPPANNFIWYQYESLFFLLSLYSLMKYFSLSIYNQLERCHAHISF